MLATLSGIENLTTILGTAVGIIAVMAGLIRFLIHNATDPIATKVDDHDQQIGQVIDLANSTNIKVARIEGYMAASNGVGDGRDKLPKVRPTVETPFEGQIVEKPLIPGGA
jgi:hypothetical protein